jgi:hypothetical protein
MHLAMTGLFRAKWSAEVHEEWTGNLLINRPDLSLVQLFWQNWQLSTFQGLCDSSSMTMPQMDRSGTAASDPIFARELATIVTPETLLRRHRKLTG